MRKGLTEKAGIAPLHCPVVQACLSLNKVEKLQFPQVVGRARRLLVHRFLAYSADFDGLHQTCAGLLRKTLTTVAEAREQSAMFGKVWGIPKQIQASGIDINKERI
jgi:hypothetical protein